MKFFPGQGKVREFCVDSQGNLERTWKVREKSGNLKKMAMAGSLQKIYSVQEGKGCTFSKIVEAHLPPHWGLLLKKKNLLP